MLSGYVGEEKFLKGVSIYLKKHLYANSVSSDLWNGIGEATGMVKKIDMMVVTYSRAKKGLDISRMMSDWVGTVSELYPSSYPKVNPLQIGFPVLTVTETPNGIRVRQDRFFETGPAAEEDNQTIW